MSRKLNIFDIPTIDALIAFANQPEYYDLTPVKLLRIAREEASKTTSRKG